MANFRVTESTFSKPQRIDREAGILYGVKLLGVHSRNGREYSQTALKEAAAHYAKVGIDLDHKRDKGDRSLRDLIACRPRNVRVEAEGIFGDVHLLMAHPESAKLLEAAEKDSSVFGVSHEADLKGKRTNGKLVVESVSRVLSLDLVRHPATTNGAFESEDSFVAKEQEGDTAMADMPDPAMLLAQALAIYQKNGDMEMATKLHKLLKPTGNGNGQSSTSADDTANDPVPESVNAGSGITESDFNRLCQSAGKKAGKGVFAALREGLTLSEALEVIDGFESVSRPSQTPSRAAPAKSSGRGSAPVPRTKEELRKLLNSAP